MTKEDELLLNWGRMREDILKELEKLAPGADKYQQIRDVFRLIMQYGDAQAAKEREQVKLWMIKKLQDAK